MKLNYHPKNSFTTIFQNPLYDEIKNLDNASIDDHSSVGYILEVDLHYPYYLHDDHADYPLAPEKINVPIEILSPYSQSLAKSLGYKSTNIKKLVPNLRDKHKYILHHRNLKLYTQLGLEVIQIHRVLKFNQASWMKPYIDFNTEKRLQAQSVFEQDFFKYLINSCYGKTIENVRKRIDIRLVTCPPKNEKISIKTNF